MKAIITVGLGFGDEGKGATVDYLTRARGAELVVRYCGGPQAGHNVQLSDGRRHTFSQLGAGCLAGAKTHLGPRMIISPATLVPEVDHLRSLGVADPYSGLSVHPQCLVSTAYHVWMNRLRETSRGGTRHGSCGLGVGETRNYWLRYGGDAIVARDLHDTTTLFAKLSLMRDRFLLEMQELANIDDRLSAMIHQTTPNEESDVLRRASQDLRLQTSLPPCETAIFEGSQGMLLDEWKGFHPYTTWSTVTPLHALEMLADEVDVETTVIGITRAYATRHGAGPFPACCSEMSAAMTDLGNPSNDWQGDIRFGPLDLVLLEYAARLAEVDGIVVNHLDELPTKPSMAVAYQGIARLPAPHRLLDQERLTERLETAIPIIRQVSEDGILDAVESIAPICGVSRGPCHVDREWSGNAPRVVAGVSSP